MPQAGLARQAARRTPVADGNRGPIALKIGVLSPLPKRLLTAAIDTLIPARCPLSGVQLGADEWLAPDLLEALIPLGTPAAGSSALAAFEYGGPLADLIRQAKFHPDESAARTLAAIFADRGRALVDDPEAIDGIAFVPAHWRRRAMRGFDLPALLARSLSAAIAVPVADVLTSPTFHAPFSAGASRQDREQMSAGRFVVTTPVPQRLLLVDDVVTTGATLAEAKRVLEAAGAEVRTLALARADNVA